MTTAVVVGTRPEIIKLAPVVYALQRAGLPFYLLHTGQHYDHRMDLALREALDLPEPEVMLGVGSGSHGCQTAKILEGAEEAFRARPPRMVLVQGDTNTAMAAALAAAKLGLPVGHVEAGLRSYDRRMPEELNRVVADHIATHLFAPTAHARDILLGEGLPDSRIEVTGNTVADVVMSLTDRGVLDAARLEPLGLKSHDYILVTAHRPENVDAAERLQALIDAVDAVCRRLSLDAVVPCHPRTRARLKQFGMVVPDRIVLTEPMGLFDFLTVERHATLVLTDSGGVQEESCILQVPCVTLRDTTERPETVQVGANRVAGIQTGAVLEAAEHMLKQPRTWDNPFGDGQAGERIVASIERDAD